MCVYPLALPLTREALQRAPKPALAGKLTTRLPGAPGLTARTTTAMWRAPEADDGFFLLLMRLHGEQGVSSSFLPACIHDDAAGG